MNDPNKELLTDLNFRTALLESVDWDETQFTSLLLYMQNAIAKNNETPEDLLKTIKKNYGISAHRLIKKMFIDIYIENGLYIKSEEKHEH